MPVVLTDAAGALAVEVEEAVDEAPPFAARDRGSLRAFWVCERLVAAFVWRGAEAREATRHQFKNIPALECQ